MHFLVWLHCLHRSHAMREAAFKGWDLFAIWHHDISHFLTLLDFFFSVKPDILLSFSLFLHLFSPKIYPEFSSWRYCATFEMMELEVSIQSYKSNFTLTLRNIQRGSHMQGKGRYILWHWLVLCISVFRLNLKLFFLRLELCKIDNWSFLWECSLECV